MEKKSHSNRVKKTRQSLFPIKLFQTSSIWWGGKKHTKILFIVLFNFPPSAQLFSTESRSELCWGLLPFCCKYFFLCAARLLLLVFNFANSLRFHCGEIHIFFCYVYYFLLWKSRRPPTRRRSAGEWIQGCINRDNEAKTELGTTTNLCAAEIDSHSRPSTLHCWFWRTTTSTGRGIARWPTLA